MNFTLDRQTFDQLTKIVRIRDNRLRNHLQTVLKHLYGQDNGKLILRDSKGFSVWCGISRKAEYHSYNFSFAKDRYKLYFLCDLSKLF
jgi:hypothetical protein